MACCRWDRKGGSRVIIPSSPALSKGLRFPRSDGLDLVWRRGLCLVTALGVLALDRFSIILNGGHLYGLVA